MQFVWPAVGVNRNVFFLGRRARNTKQPRIQNARINYPLSQHFLSRKTLGNTGIKLVSNWAKCDRGCLIWQLFVCLAKFRRRRRRRWKALARSGKRFVLSCIKMKFKRKNCFWGWLGQQMMTERAANKRTEKIINQLGTQGRHKLNIFIQIILFSFPETGH